MRGGTFERELAEVRREHDWARAELADLKRSLALKGVAGPGLQRRYEGQPRDPHGQWDFGKLRPGAVPVPVPRMPRIDPTFGASLGVSLRFWRELLSLPGERRAAEFRSSAYDLTGTISPTWVGNLSEEEVRALCPGFELVQKLTDQATRDLKAARPDWLPAQLGTAIHKKVADDISSMGRDDIRAEVSRLKSQEKDADYGVIDSIRIDAYEKVGEDRVCIYDLKTGRAGLTGARMAELAENSALLFKGLRNIVVIETRPTP